MVCRAMANFGAHDLRLVNPCEHLHPEARKFAVGAASLLEEAKIFPDLTSAIADLNLAIAATRRTGAKRGAPIPITETPDLLCLLGPENKLGLIFGREDAGLTSDEVALCTHTATVPTSAECGSLNLAQAVLIFLYELCRLPADGRDKEKALAPVGDLNQFLAQMESILRRIAFLNPQAPDRIMNPLRRIYQRAGLSHQELGLLRSMWTQLAWSIRDWRGRKRGDG